MIIKLIMFSMYCSNSSGLFYIHKENVCDLAALLLKQVLIFGFKYLLVLPYKYNNQNNKLTGNNKINLLKENTEEQKEPVMSPGKPSVQNSHGGHCSYQCCHRTQL